MRLSELLAGAVVLAEKAAAEIRAARAGGGAGSGGGGGSGGRGGRGRRRGRRSEGLVAQGVCSDREALDEVRVCTRPGSAIALGHAAGCLSAGAHAGGQPPRIQPLTSGAMGSMSKRKLEAMGVDKLRLVSEGVFIPTASRTKTWPNPLGEHRLVGVGWGVHTHRFPHQ